jgi:hypothetical protein
LLCSYHHNLVHRSGWTVRGNANAELTFVGPNGRPMTSHPSSVWTAITSPTGDPSAGTTGGGSGRGRGGGSTEA